jgi:hypothetical protein
MKQSTSEALTFGRVVVVSAFGHTLGPASRVVHHYLPRDGIVVVESCLLSDGSEGGT